MEWILLYTGSILPVLCMRDEWLAGTKPLCLCLWAAGSAEAQGGCSKAAGNSGFQALGITPFVVVFVVLSVTVFRMCSRNHHKCQ